jgi:hypothetical protein
MTRKSPEVTALGLALGLVLAACSQSPSPIPATGAPAGASQPSAAPEAPVPVPAPEAAAPSPEPEAPERPPATVVIDAGEGGAGPSLVEASRQARERRRTAPPPIAVIDNENLAEYAKRGHLSLVVPRPAAAEAAPEAPGAPSEEATAAGAEPPRDETYWRTRARELRRRWREAADQVADLETQAEALRLKFYTEEDTYSRDTRIKPAWDRVLDRLQQARQDAESSHAELDELLEEGRKQGALPGWLREGMELEPEPEPGERELPEHEPSEPQVVEPPSPRGGQVAP